MAISCPVCATPLEMADGRPGCPRCDFWKTSYGSSWWMKHARNVGQLLAALELRFPWVTWTPGLGALSPNRLDLTPGEKNEADLTGWMARVPVCMVEVSGTDSTNVKVPPEPILIRPGKIQHAAQMAGEVEGHYYFWMVYEASEKTYLIPIATAMRFYRTRMPQVIRGRTETYCQLPWDSALPSSALFELVDSRIHEIAERISK